MARLGDHGHSVGGDLGAHVVGAGGVGEGGQNVQSGDGGRRPEQGREVFRHFFDDLPEYCRFQLRQPLLGAEDLRLKLLQLVGDVALGVDQGLLAHVVVGDQVDVGLGHLYVVAEHLVEPDLQRLDAGTLSLARLQPQQPLVTLLLGEPQLVHFLAVARPHHIAFGGGGGSVVGDGPLYQRDRLRAAVHLRRQLAQQGAFKPGAVELACSSAQRSATRPWPEGRGGRRALVARRAEVRYRSCMSLMHARTSERRNTSALSSSTASCLRQYPSRLRRGVPARPELPITHGGARCVDELDQAMLPAFRRRGRGGWRRRPA